MDKQILIGFIVGLAVYSTTKTFNSSYFSKIQKYFLVGFFLLPPLQWLFILIFYLFNKLYHKQIGFVYDKINEQISELDNLKKLNLLSNNEYYSKLKVLEDKFQNYILINSNEYKTLLKLKNDSILSNKEFEEKINILRNQTNSSFHKYFENTNKISRQTSEKQNEITIVNVFWVILSLSIITFILFMFLNS